MAARAWLAAGQPEEAQEDLKQAIARDPDDPETRSLLAEIALKEGKPATAAEHLKHALDKGATPSLRFQMAVAQTGLGNLEAVQAELREAGDPKDEVELRGRYDFAIPLLDGWAKTESGNLVALFQRALVRRTDPAVAEQVVRNKKQLDAFVALAQALPVPARHQSSHDRRLVALRLMVQCVGDLAAFLSSGSEDLISEGRISLGEAIRSLNSAMEEYRKERTGEG
jgi:tetratricopeptide (TPR) repeat protein